MLLSGTIKRRGAAGDDGGQPGRVERSLLLEARQ